MSRPIASTPSERRVGAFILIIAVVAFVGLLDARPSEARAQRLVQVPNGFVSSCLTCHTTSSGGPRNPFGQEIEANFLSQPGPTGVVQWGPALAALNSDGDGATNGAELNDPTGAWTIGSANPGDPETVTLPGFSDVPRVPLLSPLGVIGLVAGLAAVGARTARCRRRSADGLSG